MAPHRFAAVLVALSSSVDASYPGARRGYRGMSEKERVQYYNSNGYRWPPATATKGWPPSPRKESSSYKKSRDEFEAWIRRNLTTYKATFDEWATLAQSRAMPAFTPRGFEVFDLSETDLYKSLKQQYDAHVRDPAAFAKLRREHMTSGSSTGNALFYHQSSLNQRCLDELRPRMEAWAGCPLRNGQAYGVRVYGPGSTLVSHVDRSETHVISAIFHIDRDLDAPWPLEIEDHDGRWNLVDLKPGELCMYESAKMYHARLRPMKGRAYASVFLHWYPRDGWNWTMWDTHVAVPPDFEAATPSDVSRRAAVDAAGPPPMVRSYEEYWAARGVVPPPLPRGIEDPVQSVSEAALAANTPEGRARRARGAEARELAKYGDEAGLRALFAKGDADLTDADENGWTCLHEAARSGSEGAVRLLVENGADPAAMTRGKETPHHLAKQAHGAGHPVVGYLAAAAARDEL